MTEREVVVSENGNGPYGQSIVAGGHALTADEPSSNGGRDAGPDPYELLLSALGACTAMTLRMYASRHGWPLEHVEVRLRHVQRASETLSLHDCFERVLVIKGALGDEQRARLVEIADRCPVSRTLQRNSEVLTSLASDV